mmetsp:Transcript_876/g.2055  ORF Transcript_876/g.2055 Transcript_876/m.2055 type:complete len:458 (-) Transcript_876:319-1692(-)
MQTTDEVEGNRNIVLTLGVIHLLNCLFEGYTLRFSTRWRVSVDIILVVGRVFLGELFGRYESSLLFEFSPQVLLETTDIHFLGNSCVGNINLLDLTNFVKVISVVVDIVSSLIVLVSVGKGESTTIIVTSKVDIIVVVKTECIVFDIVETNSFASRLGSVVVRPTDDSIGTREQPRKLGDINVGIRRKQEILVGLGHLKGISRSLLCSPLALLLLKDGINVGHLGETDKETVLLYGAFLLILGTNSILLIVSKRNLAFLGHRFGILFGNSGHLLPMRGSSPQIAIGSLLKLLHVKEGIITVATRSILVKCIAITESIQKNLSVVVRTTIGEVARRIVASIVSKVRCKLSISTKVIRSKLSITPKTTEVLLLLIFHWCKLPSTTLSRIQRKPKVGIKRHSQHRPTRPLHSNMMDTLLGLLLFLFRSIIQVLPTTSFSSRGILFVHGKALFFECGVVIA